MAQWNKIQIIRENGEFAEAQAPIIVSASRSTDIPAFYSDWFFHRLKIGYSAWTNPFNGVKSFVSYEKTRFIVFWSKNPEPLINHLDYLNFKGINCYIQFTLNDYEKEGLEQGVPKLEKRVETFKKLVKKLGKGRVIWRFDPLLLTDAITIADLLEKIENIGNQLYGYTEKLVFSFADIASYRKVQSNLERNNIHYSEWTMTEMMDLSCKLQILNKKWGYQLATCGEKIDLEKYNIKHNHCIDDELITRFAYNDKSLMDFLGIEVKTIENTLFGQEQIPKEAIILNENCYAVKKKDNKDKGQRLYCGCMASKDIGEYNTCPHLCEYCYANTSKQIAQQNYLNHCANQFSETITGK